MIQRVRTGLRVPYEMNTILIKIAEKKGISKNSLMLQILWKWIEENEKSAVWCPSGVVQIYR